MAMPPPIKVVIDTNVLMEGLTKQGSTAGLVVDAWLAGVLAVYVSNNLIHEYVDVLSRKLSAQRWHNFQPVLRTLLSLASPTVIHFSTHFARSRG
jgi:predicted nucleic acid-binding protein